MAAVKTSKSVIDNLPEVQRRKVVDAILAGESLRTISKLAGISAPQVNAYKKKVVMPAIRAAQQVQAFQQISKPNSELVKEQTTLTKDIIRASPFRDRLETLWQRTDRALDKAEETNDLAPMAPLLNVAHKNCEMLGRATGELESVANNSVAIQIVYPAAAAAAPPSEFQTIDIALPKR